jgi:hypothetical protein
MRKGGRLGRRSGLGSLEGGMSRLIDDSLEVSNWWGDDVFAFALCSELAIMFSVSLFIDKVSTLL